MASTLSEPLCCHQARIVAAPKIIAARSKCIAFEQNGADQSAGTQA